MTRHAPAPEASTPQPADLTAGQALEAVAGPLAWAVHFMVTSLAVEGACRLGRLGGPWLGLTGLGWFTLAATVLSFGLIAWTGLRAYRRWRSYRAEGGATLSPHPAELLALAGWSQSLLFAVLVILSLVPLVVLRPCAWN